MVAMMKGAAGAILSYLPFSSWGSKASAPVANVSPDQRANAAASTVLMPIPYDQEEMADESSGNLFSAYCGEAPHISSALATGDLTDEVKQWLEEKGWTPDEIQKLSTAKEDAQFQSGDAATALNEELMKQAIKKDNKECCAVVAAIPKYDLSATFLQGTRKQLNERISVCRRMLKLL